MGDADDARALAPSVQDDGDLVARAHPPRRGEGGADRRLLVPARLRQAAGEQAQPVQRRLFPADRQRQDATGDRHLRARPVNAGLTADAALHDGHARDLRDAREQRWRRPLHLP
jgi:hypothetical protein